MESDKITESERILRESEIRVRTEELQQECHLCTEDVFELAKVDRPDLTYQDVTNVFLLRKIAELQLELMELKLKFNQE
jgi:hypothetical protein